MDDIDLGLAPRGASGLKYRRHHPECQWRQSRPARGEWIEIIVYQVDVDDSAVSPREGRVD